MINREELENFEISYEGEHYYVCAEVNKFIDSLESDMKDLENTNKEYLERIKELENEIKNLKKRTTKFSHSTVDSNQY